MGNSNSAENNKRHCRSLPTSPFLTHHRYAFCVCVENITKFRTVKYFLLGCL